MNYSEKLNSKSMDKLDKLSTVIEQLTEVGIVDLIRERVRGEDNQRIMLMAIAQKVNNTDSNRLSDLYKSLSTMTNKEMRDTYIPHTKIFSDNRRTRGY